MAEWTDILRLVAATAAGALIGFEREINDKPAGFRTNILICLGAAVFALLSERLAVPGDIADRTRIAAQIVTGVGFLGAGAIIQFRGNVIGLTTAATIWVVASVGMAFGGGAYLIGGVATVLVVGVLLGLSWAERRMSAWRTTARFELELSTLSGAREALQHIAGRHRLRCDGLTFHHGRERLWGEMEVTGSDRRLDQFVEDLSNQDLVQSVRRR